MSTRTAQPLMDAYLDRLYTASAALPAEMRDDLVADIESHLGATLAPDASRAEVRLALARLGPPEEIVAAAIPPAPTRVVRRGVQEWVAITALLLAGVALPVFGWTVGLVMLWSSRTWRAVDKVVGTLLFPGGLATAAALIFYGSVSLGTECGGTVVGAGGHQHSTNACHATPAAGFSSGLIEAIAIFTLLPLLGALYLALRARPHTVRAYPAGATWVERRGPRETLTIALLLVGGLVIPVVGWIAGVALLWTSRAWDRRDRLIGTLLIPGGLAIPTVYLVTNVQFGGGADNRSNGISASRPALYGAVALTLTVVSFVVPIVTAVYLSRRARAHEVHSRFGR